MSIVVNPETGTKYSRAELLAAMTLVENPSNWKMPIQNVMISATDQDVVREAVIFFTGSVPTFRKPVRAGFDGQLIVSASGYYATIGA